MSKKLPSEQSCLVKNKKSFKGETIILAFSGGLDTSFCVPYLIEQGFQVVTAFIDSGGVSNAEKEAIKRRALALGAFCHEEVSITEQLWEEVITPLVYADHWYQNQYYCVLTVT
jgi:argininosuccinate synthase